MIRVERNANAQTSAALLKAGKSGLTEKQHAMWHFANVAPDLNPLPVKPAKAPAFAAYKKQPVKDALEGLFGTKCAYCESAYAHVGPMDVEHFRPKGGYLDEKGVLRKPGYYWLAASWENLLPSCIDCNRERKHFRRGSDGKLVKSKSGKANRFPVAPGTPRASCEAEVLAEQPLLLDPCNDNPGEHLRFTANGWVMALPSGAGAVSRKGAETIDVFGLTRDSLVNFRRDLAVRAKDAMVAILDADRNVRAYPQDAALVVQLQRREASLQEGYLTQGQPFLAMTLQMNAAFVTVRNCAQRYHTAKASWDSAKDAPTREALVAVITDINAVRQDETLDRAFVTELLALAEVPSGPVG